MRTFRFICVGSVRQPKQTKRRKNQQDLTNVLFQKITIPLPQKVF